MRVVIKQITKFVIIGLSAVLVDLIVYYAFSDLLGFNQDFKLLKFSEKWSLTGTHLSKAAGFVVGSIYTYLLNKHWTWRYTEKSNKGMIAKFITIYALSLLMNVLVNEWALNYFPDYLLSATLTDDNNNINTLFAIKGGKFLAFFIATAVCTLFNFMGQKFWIFNTITLDPKDETNIEVS